MFQLCQNKGSKFRFSLFVKPTAVCSCFGFEHFWPPVFGLIYTSTMCLVEELSFLLPAVTLFSGMHLSSNHSGPSPLCKEFLLLCSLSTSSYFKGCTRGLYPELHCLDGVMYEAHSYFFSFIKDLGCCLHNLSPHHYVHHNLDLLTHEQITHAPPGFSMFLPLLFFFSFCFYYLIWICLTSRSYTMNKGTFSYHNFIVPSLPSLFTYFRMPIKAIVYLHKYMNSKRTHWS